MRERLLTAWVGPLTLAVHLLGVSPDAVGSYGDDVLYLGMGTSLAREGSLVVAALPGAPEVAKYPLGYPALIALLELVGLDPAGAGRYGLLALNAIFWAVAAQLLVDAVLPRVGATRGERVAVGLLVAVNTATFKLVGAAMSEPLFTLLLVGGFAVGLAALVDPTPRRLVALALLAAGAGLVRSVASPVALAAVALALLARRPRVAAAAGVGWALPALVAALQRAAVSPPSEAALRALRYYVTYDAHGAFYARPLLEGDLGLLAARFGGVLAANLAAAPRSFAAFVHPADLLDPGGGAGRGLAALGAAALALAAAAALRAPALRPLLALVAAYTAVFLVWTWPFSPRFWLPVYPVIAAACVMAAARAGRLGRLAVGPLVGLVVAWNALLPIYRAPHAFAIEAPSRSEADEALDVATRWLDGHAGPRDAVVGDRTAMWVAHRLGRPGVELDALLPADDHLGLALGLLAPTAEAPRLAGELSTSLEALDALLPDDAAVWLVAAAPPDPSTAALFAALEALGRVVPVGGNAALRVWRAAPGDAGATPPGAGAAAPDGAALR